MNSPETRGGMRPTAPQNNPANVNGVGGNGTSGDYSGFTYGQNKTINENRETGNAAIASMNTSAAAETSYNPPALTSILDETQEPNTPVTDGAAVGKGLNYVPNLPSNPSADPDIEMIRQQLPLMQTWASMPGTSRATAEYTNYLTQYTASSGEQNII